jgi:hypothetical protein
MLYLATENGDGHLSFRTRDKTARGVYRRHPHSKGLGMSSRDELAAIESDLGGIARSARRIKNDEQAYAILANLVAVTSRINSAISSGPGQPGPAAPSLTPAASAPTGAVASLQGWIQMIKSALEALATFLKAASYTVGVSVPLGLSVQITFSV